MSTDSTDFTLLQTVLGLTSSLDLGANLQNFVDQVCALTSPPHVTLSALDAWGVITLQLELYEDGPVSEAPESLMTTIPTNVPLLADSSSDTPDPDLPAPIPSFLGVSVLVHEQIHGCLYPCGKVGGYSPADAAVLNAFTPAASTVVKNAHLYAGSKRTEQWTSTF